MHHLSKILPATLILLLAAWLAPQPASAQDAKPVGVRLQQIVLPEVVFEGLPLPELGTVLTPRCYNFASSRVSWSTAVVSVS